MGAIWFTRANLIGEATELVGYKAGLDVTRERALNLLDGNFDDLWLGDDDEVLRVRSEEFEELFAHLLYRVGYISSPSTAPPIAGIYHRVKDDEELLAIFMEIASEFPKALSRALEHAESEGKKSIDLAEFLKNAEERYGSKGLAMAAELVDSSARSQMRSPWNSIRRIDWSDLAHLEALFNSESLETNHGTFLDQRFIDYLARNFGDIDQMNWRKFEGLTAEYFAREGWRVELGPGRNDDGVDVRVWSYNESALTPTILVQCKRQREKVGKVVVKALHADVLHAGAHHGLIVTTSSLSPGAKRLATARAYPIQEADRDKLRVWLELMRTPGTGAFLSE